MIWAPLRMRSPQEVDLFAYATAIPVDPPRSGRAANGPVKGTIAHGYLTLSLAALFNGQGRQIRSRPASNYGSQGVVHPRRWRGRVSQILATATVTNARQKTSGVEAVFTPTYEIRGEKRPACVADVLVLYS